MKSEKTFSFFFLIAALVFCISCGGGGDKYSDVDDEPAKTDNDDSEPEEPESDDDIVPDEDNDPVIDDADTISESDDDTPDVTDDDGEIPGRDDKDSVENDTDPVEEDNDPIEDNDPVKDEDPAPDFDDEVPDIDEKEDPAVLCTGQTKCFNTYQEISCYQTDSSFYGQDGLYSTAQPPYCLAKVLNASDELVTDTINGLVWQRNLPSKYDGCTGNAGATCLYEQAVDYCDNLEYGGYSDWRLPTPKEFGTIIDYGKQPAIDSEKLPIPKTSNKTFWTQTKLASSTISNFKVWYVNFSNGEISDEEDKGKYVRCVRGEQLKEPDFSTIGSGDEVIVKDSVNNLHWAKNTDAQAVSWESALVTCQELEYGGHDDWRLPSINELASLVDYSKKDPASLFPDMAATYFWSSTTSQSYAPNAWTVVFSTGRITGSTDKTNTARVICVR